MEWKENNKAVLIDLMKKRGFVKEGRRDLWTKESWTIRFFEDDVEVYDDPEKSGRYFIDDVNTVDLRLVLEEIDESLK